MFNDVKMMLTVAMITMMIEIRSWERWDLKSCDLRFLGIAYHRLAHWKYPALTHSFSCLDCNTLSDLLPFMYWHQVAVISAGGVFLLETSLLNELNRMISNIAHGRNADSASLPPSKEASVLGFWNLNATTGCHFWPYWNVIYGHSFNFFHWKHSNYVKYSVENTSQIMAYKFVVDDKNRWNQWNNCCGLHRMSLINY